MGPRGGDADLQMLRDLRFHDLRHEATSRLFKKGLNPMEVAAIIGHKTLQMFERYTHLRAEDLVDRLGGGSKYRKYKPRIRWNSGLLGVGFCRNGVCLWPEPAVMQLDFGGLRGG